MNEKVAIGAHRGDWLGVVMHVPMNMATGSNLATSMRCASQADHAFYAGISFLRPSHRRDDFASASMCCPSASRLLHGQLIEGMMKALRAGCGMLRRCAAFARHACCTGIIISKAGGHTDETAQWRSSRSCIERKSRLAKMRKTRECEIKIKYLARFHGEKSRAIIKLRAQS